MHILNKIEIVIFLVIKLTDQTMKNSDWKKFFDFFRTTITNTAVHNICLSINCDDSCFVFYNTFDHNRCFEWKNVIKLHIG
ncbi:hypothetical protein SDC9_91005 [bioreactor metagenome]|uniref:Uncharacterized protein n=1 Tax=bioreactor metagenome TaxID=1076179 RepID=A0A644ZU80_9ZZZZ